MTQYIINAFKLAIVALCCISFGLCGCKDDLFIHPQVDSPAYKARTLFIPPSTDSAVVLSIGDTARSFVYSKHPKAYYIVKNEGKSFIVQLTNYATTSQKQYASVQAYSSDEEFLETNYLQDKGASNYLVQSTNDKEYIIIGANYSSNLAGYFKIQLSEVLTNVITENDGEKIINSETTSNRYNYYSTRVFVRGVANVEYQLKLSSAYTSWTLYDSKGNTLKSGTLNYNYPTQCSFTFPSDGKDCYIEFSGSSFIAASVQLSRAKEGQTDALSIYPSRNKTGFNATTVYKGDFYPSKWFKFYGKSGVKYLINKSQYYSYSLSILDAQLNNLSNDKYAFTMPNASFVYIKLMQIYSGYSYKDSLYIYPETSLMENAISASVGASQTITLTANDYIAYSEEKNIDSYSYNRWFKYSLNANTNYRINVINSQLHLNFYNEDGSIFNGYTSSYYNYSYLYNITPSTNMTLYIKVYSSETQTGTLYVNQEQ